MYLVKNAIKNLGRNKGRNILLIIVILAVIISVTVSIVINQTAVSVIDDYKDRFGVATEIVVDWDKINNYKEIPIISAEQYLNFADSKYLNGHSINFKLYIALIGAKAIEATEQTNIGHEQIGSVAADGSDTLEVSAALVADANPASMEEFQSGVRKIIDGKLYSNKNECIISKDFAELNNLKIGDTITIAEATTESEQGKIAPLTIAGIYVDSTKEDQFSQLHPANNRKNEILVSIDTLESVGFRTDMIEIKASYELTSPDVLHDFEKEVRSKGLPDIYEIFINEAAYNKVVGPVQGLAKITNVFMWIVLIVGGAIILLVAAMAIRERKYEMAVLRAMGLKKHKVISMLLVEMLLITSIGLVIGFGIGTEVSQPVANTLLSQQVEIAKESQTTNNDFGYPDPTTANVKALTEINVAPSSETLLKICFIAFIIAMLSTTMGAYYVTKYEPLKLLSERN